MKFLTTQINVPSQPSGSVKPTEEGNCLDPDDEDGNQVTPQWVIEKLYHYTIRPDRVYTQQYSCCGICNCKYNIGNQIICLPCQHNFHDYCIENWLKWVKPTCPIDKKSVIRSQYKEDMINERRKRVMETYSLHDSNTDVSSNEEIIALSGNERDTYDSRTSRKTSTKKRGCEKMQIPEPSMESTPDLISPLRYKQQVKSKASSVLPDIPLEKQKTVMKHKVLDSTSNSEERSPKEVLPDKCYQQLKESIDEIRTSIKSNESNRKKCENSAEFQEALDTTVIKLADAKIQSPETMPKDRCKILDPVTSVKSISPSKNKVINKPAPVRRITDKRNATFADLLKIEKVDKSGWIYKRNSFSTFPNDARSKYNHSSNKKL